MKSPVNLFADLPDTTAEEVVDVLASFGSVRIERIVSTGHRSPDGFWYDQEQDEWVVVLRGAAILRFDDDTTVPMQPGDHVMIPSHRRHRVDATSADEPTVWLAVFFG